MIKEKIYIFDCCNSLGGRNKARVKAKKKLLDRKTEEAVSLAQSLGRSSLIPDWCKAPEDINPPEVDLGSDAPQALEALESPEACTEQEPTKKGKKKRKKNKEKPQQSLDSKGANGGPGAVAAEGGGVVACGPGEREKKVPSENSETPTGSALIGTRSAGPREIDDVTEHPPESESKSQSVMFTVPVEHPLESGGC